MDPVLAAAGQVKSVYKRLQLRNMKIVDPFPTRLLLASASPRRLELLRRLGLSPRTVPSDLHETEHPGEEPRAMVRRLAEAKGRSVAAGLDADAEPWIVLAADTEVVVDGESLGKPAHAADAVSMLRRLRGRAHEVMTGVFLLRTDDRRALCEVETTRVRFRDYDEETIHDYVASGEPLGKAGAYAIQGRGAALAEEIDGSWSNVVGLPVERLAGWMARIGIDLDRLRG